MEEKNKNFRKPIIIIIMCFQIVSSIAIGLWAITQKVEVDKQKQLVIKAENTSILIAKEIQDLKREAEINKNDLLRYKKLYEESLKQKK